MTEGQFGQLRLLRSKLAKRRVWERIAQERLTEPLHLNVASLGVLAFGTLRQRIAWDLVVRPHYAYGVLKAADLARAAGHSRVAVLEFGVASGAGLLNLADLARRVTVETGVAVEVHGFDSGTGMPPPVDHRDHPDLYAEGDFPMDHEALRRLLPDHAHLHLGPLAKSVPALLEELGTETPIGFVSLDVDYYSSTVEALRVFDGPADSYLPLTVVYADDINLEGHNSACGELLALDEFNRDHPLRRIERHDFFEHTRIFRRVAWVKQILFLHVLDHLQRSAVSAPSTSRYIENPFLGGEQRRELFHPTGAVVRG